MFLRRLGWLIFVMLQFCKTLHADVCPDYNTRACLLEIQQSIDNAKFEYGRVLAETQCWQSPLKTNLANATRRALLYNAHGCFLQSSLEHMMGNYYRSFQAKEKALQIASWGCGQGLGEFCRSLGDIFEELIEDRLSEFAYDVSRGAIEDYANLAIRYVRVSRSLPRHWEKNIREKIRRRLEIAGGIQAKKCTMCEDLNNNLEPSRLSLSDLRKIVSLEAQKLNRLASAKNVDYFLDASVTFRGTDSMLSIKLVSTHDQTEVWSETYGSEETKLRYQKLAIAKEQITSREQLELYDPDYQVLFGLGGIKMDNVAGFEEDELRMQVSIRVTEKFYDRSAEFGLLAQYQLTMRDMNKRVGIESRPLPTTDETEETAEAVSDPNAETEEPATEEEVDPADSTLDPYRNAFSFWGIFGYTYLAYADSYDRVRFGGHIGVGMFISNVLFTPTARVGYDMFFGRRFVTSFSAIHLMETEVFAGAVSKTVPATTGFEFTLSLNL